MQFPIDKTTVENLARRRFMTISALAAAGVAGGLVSGRASAQDAPTPFFPAPSTAVPRAFNHVGINVTDIERAVAFYEQVIGANILVPPVEIVAGQGEPGERFSGLAGESFGRTQVAYLTTANGVGLELFEFTDPQTEAEPEVQDSLLGRYWKPGVWHISVTVEDVDEFVALVEANGGARASETVETPPGSGYRLAFVADPFGMLIEPMSVSFDQAMSNLL